ncbi:hypothetical protein HN873_028455, partial [Arachis hypogaea]
MDGDGVSEAMSKRTKIDVQIDPIEISSSHDNTILFEHKENSIMKEEEIKAPEVNNKKYEEMDIQLKQMEETVNNLQKMYSINQPNFSTGLHQPIMPFFHPIPPNFYGPFPGFTQTSPPCTLPSIHMHMPPYPPPFASHIPSTPLTDAIMGKLKSPIDKSTKTIAKKTNVNAGRKKELPRK